MTNEQAQRRYFLRLIPTMLVFAALSFLIGYNDDLLALPVQAIVPLAVLAGLLLMAAFWVHWRYVMEIDEFLRSIQIGGLMFGLTVVISIASIWGFLEYTLDVPNLPIFFLNPIYWVAYSLAVVALSIRADRQV
jgi:uncharacterized membrane protein (DUF485 family)